MPKWLCGEFPGNLLESPSGIRWETYNKVRDSSQIPLLSSETGFRNCTDAKVIASRWLDVIDAICKGQIVEIVPEFLRYAYVS